MHTNTQLPSLPSLHHREMGLGTREKDKSTQLPQALQGQAQDWKRRIRNSLSRRAVT